MSDDELSLGDLEEKFNPRDLVLTACPIRAGKPKEGPGARCGHTLSALGHRAFLYGGASGKRILGDALVFDVGATRWERLQTHGFSTPGPLFGHSATVVGETVYVFGGLTRVDTYSFADGAGEAPAGAGGVPGAAHDTPRRRLRSVAGGDGEEVAGALFTFDLATLQWAEPEAKGRAPAPRYMHSACRVGENLVFFGGCSRPGYAGSLADLAVFSTATGEWSAPVTTGEAPLARHGHSATDVGGGVMLVFGGANEDDSGGGVQRFNDLYALDTNTWTWSRPETRGSPPLPRAFHSHGVIEAETRLLYVFAGETAHSSSDLCVLDLDRMRWGRPLHEEAWDHELHGACVLSNKLMVHGGLSHDKGPLDDFYFLNTVAIQSGAANDLTFKIVLAGNSEVGKSCLMTRFVEDRFSDFHVSTIGVDFKTVTTMVGGKVVKLHIWDTAGQERFAQVTAHYYRGADGAVLVYDVTNHESYANVGTWADAIAMANRSDRQVATLLVGNKCDMERYRRVKREDGAQTAKDLKAVAFVETSAKDSTNVDTAFLNLARVLVQRRQKEIKKSGGAAAGAVKLDKRPARGGSGGGGKCCK